MEFAVLKNCHQASWTAPAERSGDGAFARFAKAGSRGITKVLAQSETTLRVASLHFEVRAFTGAASDQFKVPSGAFRTLILSRYTELNADQKLLVKNLNLDLPPQPPPRIKTSGKLARPETTPAM